MSLILADNLPGRVLEMAVAIQQIPSPTFAEGRRAQFVQEQLAAAGVTDVRQDDLGNVYGRLPGAGSAPPLVTAAHTDTVFPDDTPLAVRRMEGRIYGPGIGDNSLGVAGLFALAWTWLACPTRQRPPGDLWLVANVGEEGLGDLNGMRRVVEHFGASVQAYLILEGMAYGQVYHRALGVQRYRITAHTGGGHSWVDFGSPSAIHELAALVTRLGALHLTARPRTTYNVGVIQGGTTVNTIAEQACLELDLRSETPKALAELTAQVELLVEQAQRPGVEVDAQVIGQRPAGHIPAAHPLVRLARHCLEEQGVKPAMGIGSTDANIPLSQGLPAVCIGLTTGGGAHTRQEYINTEPLRSGLAQLLRFVGRAHQLQAHPPQQAGHAAG